MTRQKIIDSAIAVLNENFSAPLDRIAEKAGLSRRTLHRYFSDRESLVAACVNDMMQTWQNAMLIAYNSSKDPIEQLEKMLYAGIDCGVKYAFLNKLLIRRYIEELPEVVANTEYETARNKWFGLIPKMQRQKIISNKLPASWIRILFINMITTSIEALQSGDVAPNDIKGFAWYSLSRSIGIN